MTRVGPLTRSDACSIVMTMESELAEFGSLEQKLALLLADYNRLRAENESLKRELGRALEQNRALSARIGAATSRIDALLQQLPESLG